MSNTVHYINGCAWASGDIQMADTNQTENWNEVTCRHCLNKRHRSRVMSDKTYYKRYVLPLIRKENKYVK